MFKVWSEAEVNEPRAIDTCNRQGLENQPAPDLAALLFNRDSCCHTCHVKSWFPGMWILDHLLSYAMTQHIIDTFTNSR